MKTQPYTYWTRLPLALVVLLCTLIGGAQVASAANPTYHTTDDVSRRTTATAAPGSGYGIPRGAAFNVICQIENEPVGPYGNRLYFLTNYNGLMFVPDTWTDSPHLAGQPPIAGIPICASTTAGTATPGSATPASTYINTTTPVRMCTNLADASCRPVWNMGGGTTVSMRCWIDESNYAGTPRWFWVTGGGVAGFVSANHVSRQTSVGWCNNDVQIRAIRWAGGHLDEDYESGWCLRFVYNAYLNAGRDIGTASTAANYWRANPRQYTATPSASPPAGYLAFWNGTGAYPEGHVVLSIGNGWAISTDERSFHNVHVMSISDRNTTKPYYGALAVN